MISWPDSLVMDIARRKSVIFIGAGVSMNSVSTSGSRPKNWADFLLGAAEKINGNASLVSHVKKLVRNGDLTTACDIVKDEIGANAFCDFARKEYLSPGFQSADIHSHIESLDSRIVVTTNVDKIYDNMIQQNTINPPIVKTHTDNGLAEAVRLQERLLLKIHGTIDNPNDMIFTRRDYISARRKNLEMYKVISALAITHTFLFLGCGLSDPDITLIFENYSNDFTYGRNHFFTATKKDCKRMEHVRVLEETRNIKFLKYDQKDNHAELTDSLKRLADDVYTARSDLSTNSNW